MSGEGGDPGGLDSAFTGLNVNAKPFVPNVNAPEFVPSGIASGVPELPAPVSAADVATEEHQSASCSNAPSSCKSKSSWQSRACLCCAHH